MQQFACPQARNSQKRDLLLNDTGIFPNQTRHPRLSTPLFSVIFSVCQMILPSVSDLKAKPSFNSSDYMTSFL